MTLTKNDIVVKVHGVGFTKKMALDAVESLLEIMKQTLEAEEDVLVSGFGKFCVKEKKTQTRQKPGHGIGHDPLGKESRDLQVFWQVEKQDQRIVIGTWAKTKTSKIHRSYHCCGPLRSIPLHRISCWKNNPGPSAF